MKNYHRYLDKFDYKKNTSTRKRDRTTTITKHSKKKYVV